MFLFTAMSAVTPALQAQLAALVDAHGLVTVLEGLVLVCGEKSAPMTDVDDANATWIRSGRAIARLEIGPGCGPEKVSSQPVASVS